MIKFFRKIRHNLLSDGSTGKYCKYAVGEIVLVVIGILIALQINNWNQNRLLKQEELKTLKSLLAEVEHNYTSFTQSYSFQVRRLGGVSQILRVDGSKHSFEYLDSLINIVSFSNTYNPALGLYNTTINSGKIETISNDSLKIRIAKFKDVIIDYQQEEQFVLEYSRNTLNQAIIDNDMELDIELMTGERLRTPEEKARDKNSILTLLKDNKSEKILIYLMFYLKDIYDEGGMVLAEFESLIAIMKKEVSRLEK